MGSLDTIARVGLFEISTVFFAEIAYNVTFLLQLDCNMMFAKRFVKLCG